MSTSIPRRVKLTDSSRHVASMMFYNLIRPAHTSRSIRYRYRTKIHCIGLVHTLAPTDSTRLEHFSATGSIRDKRWLWQSASASVFIIYMISSTAMYTIGL